MDGGVPASDPVVDADVVVIGGGGSGLAAAIEAASLGRSVVLIEKDGAIGGTTARSIGIITASCTPQQLRAGVRDSAQDHFEDLRRFNVPLGLPGNEKLQRLLIDNGADTLKWLMSMGLEFYGPMKELPHRKPRMHAVLPNARAYPYHLGRRALALGVDIRTSTRARRLVVEGGQVTGVVCDGPNGVVSFRARGIVLCTGDYSGSAEKRAAFLPPQLANVQPVNPLNTGDGHDMVTNIGGKILNSNLHLAGIRFQPPPQKWITRLPPYRLLTRLMRIALERYGHSWLRSTVMSFLVTILVPSPKMFQSGAILINDNGERFCDELDDPGPKVAEQPGQRAYILLDGELAEKFKGWPNYVSTAPGFAYASVEDYRRGRKDIFFEANSVAGLASKLGLPAGALERTLAAHNAQAASSGGRRAFLNRPPFIALGPVRYLINFTDGGLAVNDRLQVCGAGDQPIQGLYAAGFIGMGGGLFEGHGHRLGWAMTSGRLAGRYAAFETVSADFPEAIASLSTHPTKSAAVSMSN